MRGTHRESVVGDTPWEALLKVEAVQETQWTKDHKSFDQLVELRRLSGLTYGHMAVRRWLCALIAQGKIRREWGLQKGDTGVLTKACRYIFLK